MSVSIKSRPEKTFPDGLESNVNSVFTAMPYTFESDLYPINKRDKAWFGDSIFFDTGEVGTSISLIGSGTGEAYEIFDKIYITDCILEELNNKVHTIKNIILGVPSILILDTFIDGVANECSTVKYYNNYKALVKVSVGLPVGHSLEDDKPLVFVDELDVIFREEESDNIGRLDVSKIILSQLNAKFPEVEEVNLNSFSFCTVEFAETYELSNGVEVATFISPYIQDLIEGTQYIDGFKNIDFLTTSPLGEHWETSLDNGSEQGATSVNFAALGGKVDFSYNQGFSNNSISPILYQDIEITGNTLSYGYEMDFDFSMGDGGANTLNLHFLARNSQNGIWDELDYLSFIPSGISNLVQKSVFVPTLPYDRVGVYFSYSLPNPTTGYLVELTRFELTAFTGVANPTFEDGLNDWRQQTLVGDGNPLIDWVAGNEGDDYFVKCIADKTGNASSEVLYSFQNEIGLGTINDVSIEFEAVSLDFSELGVSTLLTFYSISPSDAYTQLSQVEITQTGRFKHTFRHQDVAELGGFGVAIRTTFNAPLLYEIKILNFQISNPLILHELNYSAGLFSVNQFQNINGGNLGQNTLRDITPISEEIQPKILTDFENPKIWIGKENYLSVYIPEETFDLVDYDGTEEIAIVIRAETISGTPESAFIRAVIIENKGSGIYFNNIDLQAIAFSAGANPFFYALEVYYAIISNDVTYPTTLTKISKSTLFLQELPYSTNDLNPAEPLPCVIKNSIRWLNLNGGWDVWHFEHEAIEGEIVKGQNYIKNDTYNSMLGEFTDGDTVEELINFTVTPTLTLFTNWLTADELKTLQRMKRAIKIQVYLPDLERWQTVNIKGTTNEIFKGTEKIREMNFKMSLPPLVTQSL